MKLNLIIPGKKAQTVMFLQTCRVTLFAFLIFIISCQKNDDYGALPEFELSTDSTFVNGYGTVSPGKLMHFKFHAQQGGQKLTNFFIESRNYQGEISRVFDTAFYSSDFKWEGSFYKSAVLAESWLFVVQDRESRRVGDAIQIYADTANSAYHPLITLPGVKLGAQNNAETGCFYSFESNQGYFLEEAFQQQQIMDLSFYYGEDELTIASPGANIEAGIFQEAIAPANWDIRNTTRFIKTSLTTEQFNTIANDSTMIALYLDADGKRKAKNLKTDDIYVFKTQQSILGLFRVVEIAGTTEAIVNLDIKLQEVDE